MKPKSKGEKVKAACSWIFRQDELTQRKAVQQLLEIAIRAEEISVWDGKGGKPYFSSCGDTLGE